MSAAERGPYRGPRVRGLPEHAGRVYLSRGDAGQPALLQVATGETPHLRLEPVQVLVTALPSPGGVAVEVQGTPPPSGRVTQVVTAALEQAADLVEVVGHEAAVRAHLSRARLPESPVRAPPRVLHPRWTSALAAAAGLALLVWPGATVNVRVQTPLPAEYTWDVEATTDNVAYTDVLRGSSTPEPWRIRERIVVPNGPMEGQDTPPCKSPARALKGGCWIKLDDKPPCPKNSAEDKDVGGCWVPVRGEKPMPVSVGREREG
ncbi:hypothetical protein [Myxococcus sp. Y35]|uniref:hypothetical protein n=1 Tax=Pseudomyxococcus flavus TaxID=3115648 RepID=UPI003CE6AE0F